MRGQDERRESREREMRETWREVRKDREIHALQVLRDSSPEKKLKCMFRKQMVIQSLFLSSTSFFVFSSSVFSLVFTKGN